MAKYNTFVVCESKSGKVALVTSSARKARGELQLGRRVEVWNENSKKESIIWKHRSRFSPYIQAEKDWIGRKQLAAEMRNSARRISRA